MDNITLLPPEHQQEALRRSENHGATGQARAVADYIAGMTDRFAIAEHARLFHPEAPT
ncbi:MAG: hypothetical protein ABR587_18115 [Candidatus Binatia bacterium]